MALSIIGILKIILPLESGEGKNGKWVKQPFVIETKEQYPKNVCFQAWQDKADIFDTLQIGNEIEVFFSPESKEYNSKWYTNVTAYRIVKIGANSTEKPKEEKIKNPFGNNEVLQDENSQDQLPF